MNFDLFLLCELQSDAKIRYFIDDTDLEEFSFAQVFLCSEINELDCEATAEVQPSPHKNPLHGIPAGLRPNTAVRLPSALS